MANFNGISSTASLADVLSVVVSSKLSDSTKLKFMAKASEASSNAEEFQKLIVTLNYYLADSAEEYDGDGSDIEYDELAIKAEQAKAEAERKAKAEKAALEKKTRCQNLAAQNLMIRGVQMFVDGAINPVYQELLNKEIETLMKGGRVYTMDTGESFVPDMEKSHLSAKQLATIEKAEIEDHKSNQVISNEDRRPMANGEHLVKICYYNERKGKEGKSDYAVICVEETKTGKRVWLPQWALSNPNKVDRSDMWKCRLYQLKAIAENNDDCIEGMTEDEAVEYLREHEFRIYTYQKAGGNTVAYLDKERYQKFLERQANADEKVEAAMKRDAELDYIGLKGADADESIEAKPWKF